MMLWIITEACTKVVTDENLRALARSKRKITIKKPMLNRNIARKIGLLLLGNTEKRYPVMDMGIQIKEAYSQKLLTWGLLIIMSISPNCPRIKVPRRKEVRPLKKSLSSLSW